MNDLLKAIVLLGGGAVLLWGGGAVLFGPVSGIVANALEISLPVYLCVMVVICGAGIYLANKVEQKRQKQVLKEPEECLAEK